MGQYAAEMIGALLWVARCTRPDVSYAVVFLARFSAPGRWSIVADRILERIISYLADTKDHVLMQKVMPNDDLRVVTYSDADHGGCPFTGRSTSGAATFISGSLGTQALVAWGSHRQGCTATSTAEAEVVALSEACRRNTLPIADLLEQALRRDIPTQVLTDSSAALAAVLKGSSTVMRHLRKNHRVSLSSTRDYVTELGVALEKVDGEDNWADVFTKALDDARFIRMREALGVVLADCHG